MVTVPVDQTRLLRSAGRSPVVLLWVGVMGFGTWAACHVPSVSHALHATAHDVAIFVVAMVVAQAAMIVIYRRAGETSVLYSLGALADQCVKHGGFMWLIYRSGRADSFFWLVYVVNGVVNANIPEYRHVLGPLFVFFPLLLIGAFAAQSDWQHAGIAVLATGLASLAFYVCSYVSVRYAALMAEREKLAQELADLRVRDDRVRIARDLHDGIGADLAALAWRARRI